MSLRKFRKLPFVKHRDLPSNFIFLPIGWAEGRYGPFLKGTILEESGIEVLPEWSKGINISLSGDSIDFLIDVLEYDTFDDLIKTGAECNCIEFLKDEKGYVHVVNVANLDAYLRGKKAKEKKKA